MPQVVKVSDFLKLDQGMNIFAPVNPLANHNPAEFWDLSEYKFTSLEKDFFANQCRGIIDIGAGQPDIRFGLPQRGLAERYCLPWGTVSGWIVTRKNNSDNCSHKQGKTPAIDSQGMRDFHAACAAGKPLPGKAGKKSNGAKNPMVKFNKAEVHEELQHQYRKSKRRRGYDVDSDDERTSLSTRTLEEYKKVSFLRSPMTMMKTTN